MFDLFGNKEKIIQYGTQNLRKDIENFIVSFNSELDKINLSDLDDKEKDFIITNIKAITDKIHKENIFIVLYTSDINELSDYNESLELTEKKVPITNIEDFCSRIEKVVVQNLGHNYQKNFNYILNAFTSVLTKSYFRSVEAKRKQLHAYRVEKNTTVEFKYFGSLYRIKSLFQNIKVPTDIELSKFHNDITKVYEREGQNKMNEVLGKVLTEFIESKSIELTPDLLTAMTYSSRSYIRDINNDYITTHKIDINAKNSKNLLTIDTCLANRYLPILFAPVKVTDIKSGEEAVIKQSLIFTTLDTLLTRYKGNIGNVKDELGNSLSHFGNMIEAYDDTFLHKKFIILSDEDWKRLYDYINTSNNVIEEIVNPDTKKTKILDEAELGNGEAKKEFDQFLLKAILIQATDIHMKPFEGKGLINFRTNTGVIKDQDSIPLDRLVRMVRMLSGDSKVNEFGMLLPQDGEQHRIIIDPKTKIKYEVDLRFGFAQGLERVYIRLGAVTSDGKRKKLSLLEMGYDKDDLNTIYGMCENNSNGLILVTGPTGSGKTTLLYGVLEYLLQNRDDVHLLTAEDPIERELKFKNVEQNKITEHATSLVLLKSFLRQDPDWMLIGETRDKELLSMVIEASQTGHLTFSTYHTNNTIETLERLSKMYGGDNVQNFGLARDSILSILRGVISVILVPKLCIHCRQNSTYEEVYERIKKKGIEKSRIDKMIKKDGEFYKRKPKGCSRCDLGFKGKQTIGEIMNLTDQKVLDEVIKGDYSSIIKQFEKGMKYVNEGIIDVDTLAKNASR